MNFMFTNELADFIWINGEFIPWKKSYIHLLTHSLHYSGAVFEGERSYSGVVFKLTEHTRRLLKSAEYMGLSIKYNEEEINDATNELLKRNFLKDAYIRPLIWRGAESIAIFDERHSINLSIVAIPLETEFRKDMKLNVSKWRKPNTNFLPPQAKSSAHYAMAISSQYEAAINGYDDSLILDQEGCVAECNVSNIFFGHGMKLITPIADRFLNGITRQTVIFIAKKLGFEVSEERIMLEDLENYNYSFMTGTSKEIGGIKRIDLNDSILHFPDPDGKVKILQHEYACLVGKNGYSHSNN